MILLAVMAGMLASHLPSDAPIQTPHVSLVPPLSIGTPLGGGSVVGEVETASVILPVSAGDIAPAEGCFLDTPSCVSVARRVRACELERDALRQDYKVWQVAAVALLGLAAGGVAGWVLAGRFNRS